MVATVPGEKKLPTGHRPVRNLTQLQYQACFAQKITFILRKINKNYTATRAALFDSNMHQIVCRLGLCPKPHWLAYSAPPYRYLYLGAYL